MLAIGDGMKTDVLGADGQGIDVLFITGGIHANEFGARDAPDPGQGPRAPGDRQSHCPRRDAAARLGRRFVTDDRRPALAPVPVDRIPDPLTGGVVAVGNFDGVHRGHQALLERARTDAARLGVPAVAFTFEPHPRTLFRPEAPVFRLTSVEAKARLLAALGLDGLVVAPFDRAFAAIPAEDFIRSILCGRFRLKAAVVGHDFHFGKGRSGTPEVLREAGARLGFAVTVVEAVGDSDGTLFASTDIRAALGRGDIERANRFLGYRWFVLATVIAGDRRGGPLLGYPTANLRLPPDCGLAHGIYAVRVRMPDGAERDGVASYGRRPTFDNGAAAARGPRLRFCRRSLRRHAFRQLPRLVEAGAEIRLGRCPDRPDERRFGRCAGGSGCRRAGKRPRPGARRGRRLSRAC